MLASFLLGLVLLPAPLLALRLFENRLNKIAILPTRSVTLLIFIHRDAVSVHFLGPCVMALVKVLLRFSVIVGLGEFGMDLCVVGVDGGFVLIGLWVLVIETRACLCSPMCQALVNF